MLGDISPQTVRITQQAVVYPSRDHVTSLRVERFDGRTYKTVDMTAVTRVILSFPGADPVIVYDSSVQAVFTHVGTTLTVDLSDYAMPASVLGCQIILYDAEHPAGQVLVDAIDAVVQFDFRNVNMTGGTPPPAVEYITDAPIDGVTYARKDGVWVPVDALVSGVASVNSQTGVVVLDAADVGADPAGAGSTAASAAVAAHTALVDPHPQYLTPAEGNAAYDVSGAAASAVSAHIAQSDPHPQYLTPTEGDARYERGLTAGDNITIDRTNPAAPVISALGGEGGGAVDSVNGKTGVVVLDAADVGADPVGAASAAVAAHVAAANPHPEYLTPAEGDTAYTPASHVGAGGAAHSNAVAAGTAGFMTGADKTKLDGISANATGLAVVQTFTGAKTLALADINTYNVSQDATAQTVTLPAQATVGWTANAEIHIERGGSGSVIVAAASGVLINGMTASLFTVGEQYSVATLKRKSENSWSLFASASCAAVVPAGVTARYWRVTVSGNNGSGYVGIGEIFLVSAGVDLDTSGKTYSASSSYSATYGPDKAFDGTINGQVYWMTHAANMPAWIQIDMGSPVSVSSIDIACSTNFGAGDIPSALDLYYSPDGASWTFAASGSGMNSSVWPLGSRKQFPV